MEMEKLYLKFLQDDVDIYIWVKNLGENSANFVCLFVTMVPCTVEMVRMVRAHLQRRLILIAGHPVQVSAAPGRNYSTNN